MKFIRNDKGEITEIVGSGDNGSLTECESRLASEMLKFDELRKDVNNEIPESIRKTLKEVTEEWKSINSDVLKVVSKGSRIYQFIKKELFSSDTDTETES